MNRMGGRVGFITGGGSGIGAATAALFAREGARVVIAELDEAAGRSLVQRIVGQGGQALFVHTDVCDDASVRAAAEAGVARFGGLDALVCCAGGSLPEDSPLHEVDMAVWDRTMTVDLKGTMHACRNVIPHIVEAGGGTVVNMSSGAGLRGANPAHIYTAAKGAIVSLTRALAGTYALRGVRVNAIAAGRVNTDRIRRTYGVPGAPGAAPDRQDVVEQLKTYPFWMGEPEDIASIVLFLSNDESRMITGTTLAADGGRSSY